MQSKEKYQKYVDNLCRERYYYYRAKINVNIERRNHYDEKRKERQNFNYSRNVQRTGLISILTAAITTKIIATYYFKKIDGYVEKMCEMTLKSNEKTVAIILHKLQENFELED